MRALHKRFVPQWIAPARRPHGLPRCGGLVLIGLALALSGCATPPPAPPLDYTAIVASAARTDQDRAEDARRQPVEFLRFTRVAPGMKVLDVWAGAGYTAELLALAVGPAGLVVAQNDKPSKHLEERLMAHPQPNLSSVVRSFDDPVPPGTPPLDLVTIILSYHDLAALPVDRVRMDERLLKALKPGGALILIDHSARSGTGTTDSAKLHRIDEATVMQEMTQAGFQLDGQSDFLRNARDPRTQAFFDMTEPTDRFALRFVKS